MAVNISGLRRNIKNVAHNYTDAQVKVREATSNDPWGPSSTQMSEIADLTYNVVAFAEIMQMIWKRLNDHGKNWRHVYKSLVLLEYLIKTGSDKVAQQCKENIFAIQTLKDFQYLDDNKDQGINVREKAKALVALLKDDERLRNERVRALKAKERFAQSTAGIGSDTVYTGTHDRISSRVRSPVEDPAGPEIEAARPQTAGEEELQLQLALAMSREEAEQEATKNRSDDMRLQLAIQKSKEEDGPLDSDVAFRKDDLETAKSRRTTSGGKPSNDLLDLDFGNPVTMTDAPQPPPPPRNVSLDPWGAPVVEQDPWGGATATQDNPDPWSPVQSNPPPQRTSPMPGFNSSSPSRMGAGATNDPWNAPAAPPTDLAFPTNGSASTANDPWLPSSVSPALGAAPAQSIDPFSPSAQNQLAEFDMLRTEIEKENNGNGGTTSPNPFDLGGMGSTLPLEATGAKPKKTVESLLGEHSKLVNLDDLVTQKPQHPGVFVSDRNPFEGQQQNPFHAQKKAQPAMNQLLNSGWTQQQQQHQQQQNLNQAGDFNPFF